MGALAVVPVLGGFVVRIPAALFLAMNSWRIVCHVRPFARP